MRPLFLAASLALLAATAEAHAEPGLGSYSVRTATELSVYQDTDATTVVTPAVSATLENVLSGWGINGSILVDVVSTASADIVATASGRWSEVRVAPALGGHKKLGDVDVAVHGAASTEPDYLSLAGGASASIDLAHKTVTPTFAYDYAHDTLGRAGASFSLFSRPIDRHTGTVAVAMVMNKSTVFVPYVMTSLELGDTSKPYRFIPMFAPSEVSAVHAGMTGPEIDPLRLALRPLEQVPTQRARWALGASILHRWNQTTLRLTERLYADTWGLKAFTTDARYYADLTPRLRVGGHLRFHAQTAVSFWQLAYTATMTSTGPRIPALRTESRELGMLYTPTEGVDVRWAMDARGRYALTLGADVMYTKFIDQLFIDHRVAVLGTTVFEVELQ